jgi:hypothetical protein
LIGPAIDALRAALAQEGQEHDWNLLQATQESLREHMAEVNRLRAALAEPNRAQKMRDAGYTRRPTLREMAALAQEGQEQILEWRPCVKLPVTVHVREQRPGETHVSTREGITPIRSDDLIMRGVAGEEYPIGRELFERTYRLGEAQLKQEPDRTMPLYTTPPRREWKGLSEEEIYSHWHGTDWRESVFVRLPAFARAIEQALKEKNHE